MADRGAFDDGHTDDRDRFDEDGGSFDEDAHRDDPSQPHAGKSVWEAQLHLDSAMADAAELSAPMLAGTVGHALAGISPENMEYGQLAYLIKTIGHLSSSVEALKARVVTGICEEAPGQVPQAGPAGHSRKEESLARTVGEMEIATALCVSENATQKLIVDSDDLVNDFPATLKALQSGKLNSQQAATIVEQARSIPGETAAGVEARQEFEAKLLEVAPGRTRPQLSAKARRLRERLHPETITRRKEKAACDRRVEFEAREDGMAYLGAFMPAEAATAAFNRIRTAARSLQGPDEPRTLTQLSTDVFAEILIGAGTTPTEGIGASGPAQRPAAPGPAGGPVPDYDNIRAEVLVTVPVLTLLGRSEEPADLEGYGPMDGATARRLAGRASSFKRILTHPETGSILSYGRTTYKVPADLKRMIKLRDRRCRAPGCNRSARFSDTDHTIPWADGGTTDSINLKTLCAKHHALKTAGLWTDTQYPDGTVAWNSPAGQTYTTYPDGPAEGRTPSKTDQYTFDPWDHNAPQPKPEPEGNDEPPPF